jgi:apolipoprotein N-acyltransferase
VAAGVALALALPPVGWWPLGVAGLVALERLVADRPAPSRFRRGTLVGAALLFPTLWWMKALTLPGYLVASVLYSLYWGAAALAVPPGRWRWLALPGALALAEAARARWPVGGVPLSTVALTQSDGPMVTFVRVGGTIGLTLAAVAVAVAVAAAIHRAWVPAAGAAAAVAVLAVAAAVGPTGRPAGSLAVAVVQGGGEQGTRAVDTDSSAVFARHVAASAGVTTPVDLVVWPEDVVDVPTDVADTPEGEQLSALAQRLGATLVAGVVADAGPERFRNQAVAWGPDGTLVDRFDKVHRVPFGEYVPLRSLLERVADLSAVPSDAIPGRGPAVLDTPAGRLGVVISWEVFFADRARDAVRNGGGVVLNPTNGSSFEGRQVQSQQVATSRMRAIETGRWVVQAAPTGYSAVVTPGGGVVARTGIAERAVLSATVGLRDGTTWYTATGDGPWLVLAAAAVAAAWLLTRRAPGSPARRSPARRPSPP